MIVNSEPLNSPTSTPSLEIIKTVVHPFQKEKRKHHIRSMYFYNEMKNDFNFRVGGFGP